MHGIETIVCILTYDGVLELGSSDLIRENWGLVQQAKSLFGSDLVNLMPKNPNPTIQLLDMNISFADIGITAALQQGDMTITHDQAVQESNAKKETVKSGQTEVEEYANNGNGKQRLIQESNKIL